MALTVTTIIATSVATFALLYEPAEVGVLRDKAARLDSHCFRFRTQFESQRRDLANPGYREHVLASLRESIRFWKSWPVDICLRTEIDWVRRRYCVYDGDFACLIEFASAIETAIPVR